ncbi:MULTISPECIES: LuxR C-terminal-related transcriptional regulator [unclassified Halomonas]|uniref:LuxR C-terminal-related transcriptional regulator n=1 Tax=unclassified Halomonas TaxID=2609666 RepID=UPI00207686AB|nr:LuxR C-terminal-related transcriptional regulator [Halomonas sp. S3-1-8]
MHTIEPQEFECQGFTCRFGPRNSEWPSRVQAQVIACIAAGLTHKEIAKLRGCSPRTVSATASALLYYLNAHRAAAAVAEAMRRGWIAPLLLALMISSITPDAPALRHRQPTRTRTPYSASRLIASQRGSEGV